MAVGRTSLARYDETPCAIHMPQTAGRAFFAPVPHPITHDAATACVAAWLCEAEGVYTPRRAEESPVYQVVAQNLETFLAEHRWRDRPVPFFVEREMRAFLDCGIPAHGFVRVHCDSCGRDRVVPFSCKGRGFCPSCGGRRMADTAAHLADRVIPEVPTRQWVLTPPYTLRFLMAYDAKLTADIHRVFV